MIFIAIIAITIIYLFSVFYPRKKFTDYMIANFPCPPTDPIFGHVLRLPKNPPGIFQIFSVYFRKYGKNFVLVRPIYETSLVISDPKDIETIMANSNSRLARKSDEYMDLEPWLGTGLLTSFGEKWFQRRKIITPTFHFNILEAFVEVMGKQSSILIEKMKPKVGNGDFDIYSFTTLLALDVICETSMGISIDAQSSPDSEYVQAVKQFSTLFQKRFFSAFSRWQFLYDRTPNGSQEKKLRQILHDFTDKVIIQRRNQILSDASSDKKTNTRLNFLDMLLNSTIDGKSLTNADIREEVDTFMFEGHDTTTSGMAFTLYQLSQNKDAQDRVYEELLAVFGDDENVKVTYQKLAELRYLDMAIKETLRLLPSVPFIGRKLLQDTVLGGVNVPAGTNLTIAIHGLHNDPDNFPNPEKWDPDRFDPSNTQTRHPFAYVPFSGGARNCIGQKFAMMELKSAVAKVVMNYELLPAKDQKAPTLQGDLILKSADGICVRIDNRKKQK